jgi:hypothetical protein
VFQVSTRSRFRFSVLELMVATLTTRIRLLQPPEYHTRLLGSSSLKRERGTTDYSLVGLYIGVIKIRFDIDLTETLTRADNSHLDPGLSPADTLS